jgi:hypothetical protein
MIDPFPRQGMIEIAAGQGRVGGQHIHNLHQKGVELFAVLA